MAEKSVFEKLHVGERDKNDLPSVLEQLNLPPKFVTFVREHKRLVQSTTILLILAVVMWSFYDTYREKQMQDGADALAIALELTGAEQIARLQMVSQEYAGTNPARWAALHYGLKLVVQEVPADDGVKRLAATRQKVAETSSLFPLITVSLAQAYERDDRREEALQEYQRLQDLRGYEFLGFNGTARIYEKSGERALALAEYEKCLGTLDPVSQRAQKAIIDEKIARLRALK